MLVCKELCMTKKMAVWHLTVSNKTFQYPQIIRKKLVPVNKFIEQIHEFRELFNRLLTSGQSSVVCGRVFCYGGVSLEVYFVMVVCPSHVSVISPARKQESLAETYTV